jgi:hypothetical protein
MEEEEVMPVYLFRNIETDEVIEELISYDDMKTYIERNPGYERVMAMPQINTVNSATFVEGHIPNSRKEAFAIEKKIAELRAQEYNMRPEDRKEVQEEIKERKSRQKAPIGVNKSDKKQ